VNEAEAASATILILEPLDEEADRSGRR
jgi:hypothetical protein